MNTIDLNAVVANSAAAPAAGPKWLETLRADLDAVTTGTFRVQVIGLREDQIEKVETWARKQLKDQANTIVKANLEREAIKPTPFRIKEGREALLGALRWTTYNNTPVVVAGTNTR